MLGTNRKFLCKNNHSYINRHGDTSIVWEFVVGNDTWNPFGYSSENKI